MSAHPPAPSWLTDRHGRRHLLRAITPDDRERLIAFFAHLSSQSLRLRFFHSIHAVAARQLDQILAADSLASVALVVTTPGDDAIHGLAQYVRDKPGSAEFALAIDDALHGEGIGTILLWRLADLARAAGVERLTALVLLENTDMLAVVQDCGFPVSSHRESEQLRIELAITAPPQPPQWPPSAQPDHTGIE